MTWNILNVAAAPPDSHALLDVSRSHLVTQVHHKLGKLFDVYDIFGIFRVCIDDLRASIYRTRKVHYKQNVEMRRKENIYLQVYFIRQYTLLSKSMNVTIVFNAK